MKKFIDFYHSKYFKKSLYGLGSLSIIGIALTLYAYKKKQHTKQESLNTFSQIKKIENKQPNNLDQSSLSNIDDVVTLHTSITLSIDFTQKILVGKVELKMRALKKLTIVSLDAKLLQIRNVQINNNSAVFNFKQQLVEALGGQLDIFTEQEENQEFLVTIEYQTQQNLNNDQVASNWLEPAQTFGNKHPFLFTQSEAIYARTLFPCQDSPSIKSTYDIEISVPAPLKAFSSGLLEKESNLDGKNIYTYKQPVEIPSYLFAICAGDLEKVQVSERTFVIAEHNFGGKCANEFSEMENYLKTIENYLTPYKWTQYTVVVLPKAFPFGGMENPNLTFVSPSLIVGDKSGTSVIIHEMVHSWSGNSMTCQNWECFWLNEGITTFIENTIIGKIFGKDSQTLHALLGNIALQKSVNDYGSEHTYTTLSPKIGKSNPDDCFSTVPYQKGFQFLKYLEQQIGEEHFRKFINIVVQQRTLNTNQFKQIFENYVQSNKLGQVDMKWEEWVIAPGMPTIKLNIPEQFVAKYNQLATSLLNNELDPEDFNKLSANEQCYILDLLGELEINNNVIRYLDEDFGLLNSKNPEILYRVLIFAIKIGYPVDDHLTNFLQQNGRMKLINPVYRILSQKRQELGLRMFNLCKNSYHSIAVALIQRMFEK